MLSFLLRGSVCGGYAAFLEKSLAKNFPMTELGCDDGECTGMIQSASGGFFLTACSFGLQISHYGNNCGLYFWVR